MFNETMTNYIAKSYTQQLSITEVESKRQEDKLSTTLRGDQPQQTK